MSSPPSFFSSALLLVFYLWDSTITFIYTFTGRLLPKTHIPHTDLTGKTCIVTGANSGIGYELSLQLAVRGATVYLACRDPSKGDSAARLISSKIPASSTRLKVLQLDTSSLASTRSFASAWQKNEHKIDILIHNAGMSDAGGRDVTTDGLGTIYCTNFLGSFVLTALLEPHLNPGARVIATSSGGQYGGSLSRLFVLLRGVPLPHQWLGYARPADSALYADSKLMQVAFTQLLQRRWDRKCPEKRLQASCFSPGYSKTAIFEKTTPLPWYRDLVFWIFRSMAFTATEVGQGASTGLWFATASTREIGTADTVLQREIEEAKGEAKKVAIERGGGGYWDRCVRRTTLIDVEMQVLGLGRLERCWDLWEKDGDVRWS
ncbi:hypothetical protein BDV97DRAFT_201971 [Delphinella strobiligena]|nr:hypothetical protein BDV97DRAFT_201971 [Delphinella strobiligena]